MGVAGPVFTANWNDVDNNPAGGTAVGVGFTIAWQNGPVDRENGAVPTGAFVEDVLQALIDRMDFYQDGKFACHENKLALARLEAAHRDLMERRQDRTERGVLGQHKS